MNGCEMCRCSGLHTTENEMACGVIHMPFFGGKEIYGVQRRLICRILTLLGGKMLKNEGM